MTATSYSQQASNFGLLNAKQAGYHTINTFGCFHCLEVNYIILSICFLTKNKIVDYDSDGQGNLDNYFKPKVQGHVQYSSPFVTILKFINPLHIFKLIYLRYILLFPLSRPWFYKKISLMLSVRKFIHTSHFWPI
jgi:hypothetical protein